MGERRVRAPATPPMKDVVPWIRRSETFLITAYARYDGDAVGCELALYFALKKLGKKPEIIQSKPVPKEFHFLKGVRSIRVLPYKDLTKTYDTALIVDSGNFETLELEGLRRHVQLGHPLINIDHHRVSTCFGTINWIEPHRAATGELIYELLVRGLKIPLDPDIAAGLYLSLSTDTGRFSYANVTPGTHRMAAELLEQGIDPAVFHKHLYENKTVWELELKSECIRRLHLTPDGKIGWISLDKNIFDHLKRIPDDFQEYIELVKSLESVETALLFREQEGDIRVSIRTNGRLDASALAQEFGGGGHRRAAGCTFHESSLGDVEKRVVARAQAIMTASSKGNG